MFVVEATNFVVTVTTNLSGFITKNYKEPLNPTNFNGDFIVTN